MFRGGGARTGRENPFTSCSPTASVSNNPPSSIADENGIGWRERLQPCRQIGVPPTLRGAGADDLAYHDEASGNVDCGANGPNGTFVASSKARGKPFRCPHRFRRRALLLTWVESL